MSNFQRRANQLVWKYNGETLIVEQWGEHSCRVRSRKLQEPEDHRYALLDPDEVDVKIEINEMKAVFKNGNLTVVAEEDSWSHQCQLSFYNQQGDLLLQELGRHGALAWEARKFRPKPGAHYELTASFESDPDEKLFGMGQYQQGDFNLKGTVLELAHRNSQASIPFCVSDKGYGFFWHNPAVGQVNFAKNMTRWVAESTDQLDYWLTAGDTPAQIVQAYMRATGTATEMPEYGLGFWQCKLRYWNQEQLLEVAREYKRREIPIDVIVCDFFHWPFMGDFRFEQEFYPDPQAMVDELKEMGIELMVSVWPQIDLRSENFEEMKAKGYLIQVERGVPVSMRFGGESVFYDATNPEARAFVWEKCRENYYDLGIRTFWLDEAEPEFGVYDYDNYRYQMGTVLEVGNIYPQLYSRGFYDGLKEQGEAKPVNLVRCAWAGSQRYGALVWSGDIHSNFTDFRHQVVAGLNMGLAGIPWWTTDIGGFAGGDIEDNEFRELVVRWFQYATFCPVMRLHGDRKPYTPLLYDDGRPYLHTGGDNEIWSFGDEAYEIMKAHINLREKLRPYTRQLMDEAHLKGTPIMRTMFFEFPDQDICWSLEDQYMFGSDVLVAPVMESGSRQRDVYLPTGVRWINLADGSVNEGGQLIQADAPIAYTPVFIREGSSVWELIGSSDK